MRTTLLGAQTSLQSSPTQFVEMLRHGSMSVEWYAPEVVDLQQPHEQDELYVVVRGTGMFRNGNTTHPFGPGDVLFVPAGVEHRFFDFTADFGTWVIFYGTKGSEIQ
ncbi:cupin domain-containing protein [Persicitalea jodogahamensis]|uniref:Cupin type-2 domain-containing protein n=1 Tax=Persicitalea jodogahamensis TaxID=402147 RepID=A0A8J3G9U3_9BACT|nr:cupin domain-containing protein [Persicitalea jodogahamensis]GHB66939.1 hypothetical protein GCM10007390_20280 [Persicitalea jodogahamensis]